GGSRDDRGAARRAGGCRRRRGRERKIPRRGGWGKLRKLGIPAVADKVVQAALKLVLEPVFEADFEPVSYGFRPMRRAHDPIAEVHHHGTSGHPRGPGPEIEAALCHCPPPPRLEPGPERGKDKRGLAAAQAFLQAGIPPD